MAHSKRILVCTVVALLVAPVAAASWSVVGQFEPDYPADVTEKLMFAETDTDPSTTSKKVYFNVVWTQIWNTGANPNVGATESRLVYAYYQSPMGYLGVWKDCNDDGYVGHIETALMEYRSELLAVSPAGFGICPDGTEHNKDGWVYEFIWIIDGATEREVDHPARYVNDSGVLMWGDTGRPGPGAPTGSCYVNFPPGTFSRTGAMLDWADCLLGRTIVECNNAVVYGGTCANPALTFEEGLDPSNSLGLGWDNPDAPDNPQCDRDHPANQPTRIWDDSPECPEPGYAGIYQQNSGNSAFTTWDCSGAPIVATPAVANPTNESRTLVNSVVVPALAPDVDGSGSFYDGLNETENRCTTDNNGDFYADLEQDVEQSSAKRTSTFILEYFGPVMTRGLRQGQLCLVALRETPASCLPPSPTFDDDTPQFFGVYPTSGAIFGLGPIYSTVTAVGRTPPLLDARTDLGNPGVDGEGPRYSTHYAYLSSQGLAAGLVLPGGSGKYGSEWCGSSTSGIVAGFDCDPTHWYNRDYGASNPDRNGVGREIVARPGQDYNLRDIDCYDGTVTSAAPGFGLGFTWLNGAGHPNGPCA